MFTLIIAIYLIIVLLIIRASFKFINELDSDLTLAFAEKFGFSISKCRGKVVWISNLTSTVGEQLAFELSNVGAKLVISGLDDRLHAIKKQCLLRNSKIKEDNILIIQPFIATEYSKHEEIVNQVVKHFKKINIFINMSAKPRKRLFEDTNKTYDKEMMDAMVFSQLNLIRLVIKQLMKQRSGHLVAINYLIGKTGAPYFSSYNGTTRAMASYFETIRLKFPWLNVSQIYIGPVKHFSISCSCSHITTNLWHNLFDDCSKMEMSSRRVARLITVMLVNNLDEAWICRQPKLWTFYLIQYFPIIYNYLYRHYLGSNKEDNSFQDNSIYANLFNNHE